MHTTGYLHVKNKGISKHPHIYVLLVINIQIPMVINIPFRPQSNGYQHSDSNGSTSGVLHH